MPVIKKDFISLLFKPNQCILFSVHKRERCHGKRRAKQRRRGKRRWSNKM